MKAGLLPLPMGGVLNTFLPVVLNNAMQALENIEKSEKSFKQAHEKAHGMV